METNPARMAAPSADGTKTKIADVATDKTFVIGPEDHLAITVWGSAGLSGNYIVRPDGYISMSLIGDMKASGRTPEQLRDDVVSKLVSGDILKSPDVNVQVLAVNSKKFNILGEVKKPGEYKLLTPTPVLTALVNAGGFNDFANKKNIIIQRGAKRFKFNYNEVIAGKKLDQNILLEPDDLIIVK